MQALTGAQIHAVSIPASLPQPYGMQGEALSVI